MLLGHLAFLTGSVLCAIAPDIGWLVCAAHGAACPSMWWTAACCWMQVLPH
jgi:hypothetical protein